MSISPYINPKNLNGALVSSSNLGEQIFPDGLDKQTVSGMNAVRTFVTQAAETTKDFSDAIENLSGVRSPLYIIGEIPNEENTKSDYVPDIISGLVRAVASTKNNRNKQNGVIIDGIGDVTGTLEVEFSKNPNVYRASEVVNNRVRKPSSLSMTVYVSNYLNDNLVGTLFDAADGFDPTGLVAGWKNRLLNGGNTRAQAALYKLKWLMENAEPFTVYTPHGIYENMLIKSLKPHTTDKTMDMLYCDIEFEEIIFYAPYSMAIKDQPARRGILKTTDDAVLDEGIDLAVDVYEASKKGITIAAESVAGWTKTAWKKVAAMLF